MMKPQGTADAGLIQETTPADPIPHLPGTAWHLLLLAGWLQCRIRELLRRLRLLLVTRGRGLRWRLSYRWLLQGAAALLLAGGMLLSPLAPAMPVAASAVFVEQTGTANPLNSMDVDSYSTPIFVDIDQDGDMDAFSGEQMGTLKFYKNTGTTLAPAFSEQTGTNNPLNVDAGRFSTPTFVDIDGDGDMDAFSGENYGNIKYYENNGTALVPAFSEQTGTSNPFDSVDVGNRSAPTFVDIDQDGDMDAFIGEGSGDLNFYKNTGTALAPAFSEQTGTNNPFNGMYVGGGYSCPTFVDIDGDGDMDAFIGGFYGVLNYYKNTGTALAPAFSEQTGAGNPLDGVDVGYYSAPTFLDIDGDGDIDAFSGENTGTLKYFKNIGDNTAQSVFTRKTGANNPLSFVDVGYYSGPAFVDIDGDGDIDAFSMEQSGTLKYYQNTGTALAPAFSEQTGTSNPFNGMSLGTVSAPAFVDIDGDGDMDVFIGFGDGTVKYHKNIGTILAPAFSQQTGTNNPFYGMSVGGFSYPTFVDIDEDGDMDAFIGEKYGTLKYYKNTGTALAPTFSQQTGTTNPFNLVDVGSYSTPTFVDIDGDGDGDALVGKYNGLVNYYKNTGTALNPIFIENSGTRNPLDSMYDVGTNSNLNFVDIDHDGDMDTFIGAQNGGIYFYAAVRLAMKNMLPLVLR